MHFWDKHKTITGYYESLTRSICDKYDLTQMEYDILMFLHGNPEFNTAADIVKIRKSTKSHVSISLKSLENKGLIEKKQSESNKKSRKNRNAPGNPVTTNQCPLAIPSEGIAWRHCTGSHDVFLRK